MAEIGIKEQEESKKLQENIKKSQTQQETEQRGGSAQHRIKNNNRDIFEYSPRVQNNYVGQKVT